MWICVKDRKGKYLYDMSTYRSVRCSKTPTNKKDEELLYTVYLIPMDVDTYPIIELEYDNYLTASDAYDYIKGQLCQ